MGFVHQTSPTSANCSLHTMPSPVYVRDWGALLAEIAPTVLIDARMRKHSAPEVQRGLAEFTVGLGPDLVAGRHADVVIETSWEDLGRIITQGLSLPLRGEPREIEGHARDRYVYAPFDGVLRTKARIGDMVRRGQEIAEIGLVQRVAPAVAPSRATQVRKLRADL